MIYKEIFYLCVGSISFDDLDKKAARLSDNDAKDQLDLALKVLMGKILEDERQA